MTTPTNDNKGELSGKCQYWIKKTSCFGKEPKERCIKKAVIIDDHGRELCQHHYNRWKAKKEKSLLLKPPQQ